MHVHRLYIRIQGWMWQWARLAGERVGMMVGVHLDMSYLSMLPLVDTKRSV